MSKNNKSPASFLARPALRRCVTGLPLLVAVFVVVSVAADVYYYRKVAQGNSGGSICYSDFKVFWTAAYRIRHHVLKDRTMGSPRFRPLWFVTKKGRKNAEAVSLRGEEQRYDIYDQSDGFYHYRYSPFVAFAMMPLGKMASQSRALAVWYAILNVGFAAALIILVRHLSAEFGLALTAGRLLAWAVFMATLRFYLLGISLGQIDVLTLLFFAVFLSAYCRGRDVLSGIMLALIFQFKPLFLPLAFYMVLKSRWKIVLAAAAAFILCLAIPSFMIGAAKEAAFIKAWFSMLGGSVTAQLTHPKNISLVSLGFEALSGLGLVNEAGGAARAIYPVCGAAVLLCCAALYLYGRSGAVSQTVFRNVEISALVMAAIVFSPLAQEAYLICLALPLSVTLAMMANAPRDNAFIAVIAASVFLTSVAGTDLTAFIPHLDNMKNISLAAGAALLTAAMARFSGRFPPAGAPGRRGGQERTA